MSPKGWHGEPDRHAEVQKKRYENMEKEVNKETKISFKGYDSGGSGYTREKQEIDRKEFENEAFNLKSIEQKKIIEKELDGVIVDNNIGDSGNEIKLSDGREYLIFNNEEEAIESCERYVEDDLREDPSIFDQDWLKQDIDTEQLGNDLAEDMYDGDWSDAEYEWNEENSEKAARIEELDKKRDEAFEKEGDAVRWGSTDEGKEYYKLMDERDEYATEQAEARAEEIKEDPMQWWDDATGEPIPNMDRYIDYEKASKDAVETDGVAHFYAWYDGQQVDFEDGSVGYRTN